MILVVGADSATGLATAQLLTGSGYRVRAIIDHDQAAAALLELGCQVLLVDGDEWASDPQTLADVDAVAWCRSASSEAANETIERLEVAQLESLADQCLSLGTVPRWVFVSRLGLEQAAGGSRRLAAAHRGELILAGHTGLAPAILRAAPTYDALLDLWPVGNPGQRGVLVLLGTHTGVLAPLAPDDLAAAILAALRRPELAGSTASLAGPATYKWAELAGVFSRAYCRPIRVIRLPMWLAVPLAFLVGLFWPGTAGRLLWASHLQEHDLSGEADELARLIGRAPQSFESWLHTAAGAPAVALPSPLVPSGNQSPSESAPATRQVELVAAQAGSEPPGPGEEPTDAKGPAQPNAVKKRPKVQRPEHSDGPVADADQP